LELWVGKGSESATARPTTASRHPVVDEDRVPFFTSGGASARARSRRRPDRLLVAHEIVEGSTSTLVLRRKAATPTVATDASRATQKAGGTRVRPLDISPRRRAWSRDAT
jgi:hypothetical protein